MQSFSAASSRAVTVSWKPFIIDPNTEPGGEDYQDYNRRRWGSDGWTRSLRAKGEKVGAPFANWQVWPNTLHAHRLMRFAGEAKGSELKGALFEACYEQGKNISSIECLVEVGVGCGVGTAEELSDFLRSDADSREVMLECRSASQSGVNGVPYFIVDGDAVDRPFGVSGALDATQLEQLFNEVCGSN